MKLTRFKLILLLFFQVLTAHAETSAVIEPLELNRLINGGMEFLNQTQAKETLGTSQWRGEFPSFMENEKFIFALGPKKKRSRDSNCFSTALIHEELARNFKLLQKNEHYAQVMNLAFENILSFKNGSTFNFWHLLDLPNSEMKTYRPNLYPLHNRFALVRANIADDADDTAIASLALLNQKKLADSSSVFLSQTTESNGGADQNYSETFFKYRDTDERKWRYPTNVLRGNFKHTGAYLTWLTPEHIPFLLSPFKSWGSDLRIPEGVNNIDCVVNANVLNFLSAQHLQDSPGFQDACHYIENAVKRNLEGYCGIYYPNPYTLHYAVGKALRNGATCLETAGTILLDRLLATQHNDGSWKGGRSNEPVQSTLFATRALMDLSQSLQRETESTEARSAAVSYLYEKRIENKSTDPLNSSISWPEGTFFTGGGFVRNSLAWKSESFATALAISIFSDLLPSF